MPEESFRNNAIPILKGIAADADPDEIRSQYAASLDKPLQLLTPRRLLPRMVLSIFIAELIVMYFLAMLPSFSLTVEAVIDSTALLVLLSPTFYFFHYHPLLQYHRELKVMIERLSASEERLALTLDAVNDGLCDWDVASGQVYLSQRLRSMLGYDSDELGSETSELRSLIHPDDMDFVQQSLEEHLQGQNGNYETEHRMRKKDGEYIWILARGRVVARDRDGAALRMVGTYTDITRRKMIEEALRKSEEDIRALTRRLLSSSEEEKKHLAQDLHDEFGQVLTAFQLGVEMLRSHSYSDEEDYQFHCSRLLKMVATLETDLRHICDHLRPIMLDDIGLIATLRWHIKEFERIDRSLKIDFNVDGADTDLSRDVSIALYRIFQESLNNVVKHAGASQVAVDLFVRDEIVRLVIRDNGRGFQSDRNGATKTRSRFGLLGMRERAASVCGRLQTTSTDQGVTVEVEIPLKDEMLCE